MNFFSLFYRRREEEGILRIRFLKKLYKRGFISLFFLFSKFLSFSLYPSLSAPGPFFRSSWVFLGGEEYWGVEEGWGL